MQSPISPDASSGNLPGRNLATVDPAAAITPVPLDSPLQANPADEQNPAVVAARAALAKELQMDPVAPTLISVEEMQWPDGCLGVRQPGVMCTQVIVDGFKVVLEANSTRYEYHTDQTGRQVVLASPR